MTQESLRIGGRTITLVATAQPEVLLIQPIDGDDPEEVLQQARYIAEHTERPFAMAGFSTTLWVGELMPWADRAVSKDPRAGQHASETLSFVQQRLVAVMIERFGSLPIIIGGYSLGGLFALWAAYQSSAFAAVAAASPSVWIAGWPDYAAAHSIMTKHVFLSLGDHEEHSRNQAMAQVGPNIRQYHNLLTHQLGPDHTTLEWNPGGHFKDPTLRTARAFAWCVERV